MKNLIVDQETQLKKLEKINENQEAIQNSNFSVVVKSQKTELFISKDEKSVSKNEKSNEEVSNIRIIRIVTAANKK